MASAGEAGPQHALLYALRPPWVPNDLLHTHKQMLANPAAPAPVPDAPTPALQMRPRPEGGLAAQASQQTALARARYHAERVPFVASAKR